MSLFRSLRSSLVHCSAFSSLKHSPTRRSLFSVSRFLSSSNSKEETNEEVKSPPTDTEETKDIPSKEFTEIQNELESAKEEISEMKNRYLRALAETENVRKRGERQVQDASKFAVQSFAKEMLSVADNLGLALINVKKEELETNGSLKTLYEGLELTHQGLHKVFEQNEIVPIETNDRVFDPQYHEVLFEVPDESKPQGTIVQVTQQGYMLKDRVLRAAKVGTTKK